MTELEWINSSWYIDGLVEAVKASERLRMNAVPREDEK